MVRCPRCGFIIPEGEFACPVCHKDVSRVMNRPVQGNARSYPLHEDTAEQGRAQQHVSYAGFWRRAAAGLFDVAIGAFLVYGVKTAGELLHSSFISAAMLITGLAYFLVLIPLMTSSRYRASPGKILCGIVITDTNGRTVSFYRALMRELGKYVSLLIAGIGFLLVGFTEKKQGLHDYLALTVVSPRSEAYLLMNLSPANTITAERTLFFGKCIIGGAILFSLLILCYFSFVLHEPVTPGGIATQSLVLAADAVADTNYPAYALPLYDTALDMAPENSAILTRKVNVLRKEGRVDEAKDCLFQAMEANPGDAVPIVTAGDLMYNDAQYQSAIRYYEKALGMNRENADVWIRKGDAYLAISLAEMQGMREQYKSLTGRSIGSPSASDPSTLDAFRSTESYREAITAYNEAIRIDPLTSVEISGRILASTQVMVGTYQGILEDIGIENSTSVANPKN